MLDITVGAAACFRPKGSPHPLVAAEKDVASMERRQSVGERSDDPKVLTDFAFEFLQLQGASAVGVATVETLAGGPPSTDLEYVLPGAKSAVSFAVPFDEGAIERYLSKQDHVDHQRDNFHTNFFVSGLAVALAAYWKQKGIPSVGVLANGVYREDTPQGIYDFMPDLSHRYIAVASGVGRFGISGNVMTEAHGACVVLGTVVTTAGLLPTEPLPEDPGLCDGCHFCYASCSSGLMDPKEKTTITLGGRQFSYAVRRSYHRCDLVCGGFTGLSKNGRWSTWSPGRFEIPESDEEFAPALGHALMASAPRPAIQGGFHHPAMPAGRKINMTCGNCQLVCHPDREERRRRYLLLRKSGVVIQHEDGALESVSRDVAERHLSAMPAERRAMYEKV
jgi:epoxyqueuosine reductase